MAPLKRVGISRRELLAGGALLAAGGCRASVAAPMEGGFVGAAHGLGHLLREPQRLKHWITRIAVHKAHRRFRRRKLLRALGLYGGEPLEDVLFVPNSERSTQEQAIELERLSEVLRALPDVQRAAWVLRFVDGHKLEQVAGLCDCSLATAKRRIAAADAIVRKHVRLEASDDL